MYEFIESSVFAKYVHDYLTEEECAGLQCYLSSRPEAGDLIPASGGCRKLRWGITDKGKRGGVRVIYYGMTDAGQIWMLAIYAKTRRENLPAHVIRLIKDKNGEVMKKLSKDILERDAKRDIGTEVLEAIREIKAGGGRRFTVHVSQATEARIKLGLSQADFAAMLGVSVRTLQDWEQGRREPSGAAKALLKVTVAAPNTVRKVLAVAW